MERTRIAVSKKQTLPKKAMLTKGGKGGIIGSENTLNFLYPLKGTDNQSIREWYVSNVSDLMK